MPFAVAYVQGLDPLGNRALSTLVAALPVVVLFYLLVGRRWLASWAGAAGAAVAVLVAWLVYQMPLDMASWAFVHGAVFGLLPIGWTVFGAMLLYNVTVETGQFAVIRRSIGGLSGDARVQTVLIGFAFGAFLEGAAGAGSPVAICGAMLVGLGVPPFRAAVLCLIANTSPVCYGGLGTPILTLAGVTDIPADTISVMCGHQLPLLSCLIPLYMVKCMCSWRDTLAVWPALLVGGGSFAVFQYTFATIHTWGLGLNLWPLTDIGGGLFSLASLALFLKFVWKPKDEWRFPAEPGGPLPLTPSPEKGGGTEPATPVLSPLPSQGRGLGGGVSSEPDPEQEAAREQVAALLDTSFRNPHLEIPLTARRVAVAWSPFLIMAGFLAVSGVVRQQEAALKRALDLGPVRTYYEEPVPTLHNEVARAERLRKEGATEDQSREAATFKITWLTAPGTPVFLAALVSMALFRMSPAQVGAVFRKTFVQMKIPIPTIGLMLGLSYVTKYAGIDATLGVAFAETGAMYPFFAALLGWLGVFLTGTDAGSNALFGSLQKITATGVWSAGHLPDLSLGQAQVLICTANSTGGVMGKMIDAQSICVATAGTNQ
ncbi:MAG: L-lactate permease, partial [Gemmataceae bacterium]|nr:L-lactate permease [Gemmataceae bacterium]